MGISAESKFHVLAVDDSLIDRKLIEMLLKTSSYQVTTVDSGSKALEFLGLLEDEQSSSSDSHSPSSSHTHQDVEVNLIITDYCMPGMTGYDLLKRIKESSSLRNIPVVIMSSENVPSRINRCLEEGAEEFFLKPVRLSDVHRLKPHMMRNKLQDHHHKRIQENIEDDQEEESHKRVGVDFQSHIGSSSRQNQSQQQNQNSNKRKSVEEGLSPDRTRPRYSTDVAAVV